MPGLYPMRTKPPDLECPLMFPELENDAVCVSLEGQANKHEADGQACEISGRLHD